MARDSEDRETRDSQPKPDNPFIKFRQFADEQISQLLQGVIGLPSAFSKTPGNTRWADFDDELRRRDELQARQKELKESEARKAAQSTQSDRTKEDAEIPAEKQSGWSGTSTSDPSSYTNDRELDRKVAKDLPLYSPVSRSLFAHLDTKGGAKTTWGPLRNEQEMRGFRVVEGPPIYTDKMKTVQHHIFDALNTSPSFRSDYSLLPYLLFSPYSPLKLSCGAFSTESDHHYRAVDPFPYCDAFEDLILLSQGRPMTGPWNPPSSSASIFPQYSPLFGYTWLNNLQLGNVLQQKEDRTEPMFIKKSILDMIPFPRPNNGSKVQSKAGDPQTEEEMYNRFLRLVSPTAGTLPGNIETLLADIGKEFGKELKDLKPEADRVLNSIAEGIKSLKPEEERALQSLAEDFIREFMPSLRQDSRGREQLESKSKLLPNSEKVVYTSTTSEHTTNEDGSVETSVTVWKRFADGRETVTTTMHTEDPARDNDGNPTERSPAATTTEEDSLEKKKEPTKKGWFWN